MRSTAGTGHAAAVRRARHVAARRAEMLREHEQAVTATLVEYFEAKDRADKIRADAQARAARLLQAAEEKALKLAEQAHEAGQQVIEHAEKDACDDDAQVGTAIRRLRELGETPASISSMIGLSQAVIRAVEREHQMSDSPNPKSRRNSASTTSVARNTANPVPE